MNACYLENDANENKLRNEFSKILGGHNFITPVIVNYVQKGKYICEISKEYYPVDHLVGVTVVDTKAKERCIDKDKCFIGETFNESIQKACDYIETIED